MRISIRLLAVWSVTTGTPLALAACLQTSRAVAPLTPWDIMLSVPGARITAFTMTPDETLIAAGPSGAWRYRIGRDTAWRAESVMNATPIKLFAPSADTVFALVQYGTGVYRRVLQAEWEFMPLPAPPITDATPPKLMSIWGRNGSDVYVGGDRAGLYRYDGRTWAYESSPLAAYAGSVGDSLLMAQVFALGGDSLHVYAAGFGVMRRDGGTWTMLRTPTGRPGECVVTAIAVQPQRTLFAGIPNRCLFSLSGHDWRDMSELLRTLLQEDVYDGRAQGDGSALMWTYSGTIVEFSAAGKPRLYRLPRFQEFRSALATAEYIYVGGTLNDTAIVARIHRR